MYSAVAVVVAVGALGAALLALRVLWRGTWLAGWVRGMTGLALAALAVLLIFAAWDLQRYRHLAHEESLATLAFARLGPQHFAAVIDAKGRPSQRIELRGDMWQLDVRLLKWHDSLLRLGLAPGYQLDRIAGRYLAIEEERSQPRTVVGLAATSPGPDLWRWLQALDSYVPVVDARYGSAAFLPMADGARYAVTVGISGLVARPLNAPAQAAVQAWH